MKRHMTPRTAASGLLIVATVVALACSGPVRESERKPENDHVDSVRLDARAVSAAEITVDSVRAIADSVVQTTGTLSYNENAVAKVGPKTEGRIVRVMHDLGDRVDHGAALAVLESQEVGDVRADAGRAAAEVELARENYEREQRLYNQRVSSEKEMLEARAAYESAVTDLKAANAKLRTLGASGTDITEFAVSAPMSGTVVERDAIIGQIVGPEAPLFTIADLSELWLIVDVYEKDLARVSKGQHVSIRTEAFPEAVVDGRIAYLGEIVDSVSRTVKARVVVENSGPLRPGMFARADIVVPEPSGTLAVPRAAVQELDGSTVVFVPDGEGVFRAVPVELGNRIDDDLVLVRSGLEANQKIVGKGSFFLKSELSKSTFGDTD